jgi:hypothetical protein
VRLDVPGDEPLLDRPEGVDGELVEPGDPPEVDVALAHLREHLGEGVDGAHDGCVEQDDFVEFAEPGPSHPLQRGLVGPRVQAHVVAQDHGVGEGVELGVALGREVPVDDDHQLGEVLDHAGEQGLDVVVHDSVGVVEEEDSKAFRDVPLIGHGRVLLVRCADR